MKRSPVLRFSFAQLKPTLALSCLVWFLGALFAVIETSRLTGSFCTPSALGVLCDYVKWCLFAMSAFTLLHQMLIFYTIYKFEERDAEFKNLYRDWVGTNFEVFLRLLAIIMILCVGGELPNLFWFNV